MRPGPRKARPTRGRFVRKTPAGLGFQARPAFEAGIAGRRAAISRQPRAKSSFGRSSISATSANTREPNSPSTMRWSNDSDSVAT